jgi:hypothetical protein
MLDDKIGSYVPQSTLSRKRRSEVKNEDGKPIHVGDNVLGKIRGGNHTGAVTFYEKKRRRAQKSSESFDCSINMMLNEEDV